jgi:hypothetical protein
MSPNVFFRVALANRDDCAILTALNEVAPQVFRHFLYCSLSNVVGHCSNALWGEISYNTAMAIKNLTTIVD